MEPNEKCITKYIKQFVPNFKKFHCAAAYILFKYNYANLREN